MPAPHPRSRPKALAVKVAEAGFIESLDSRRDRQIAHRTRQAGQWETAAATLDAAEQRQASRPDLPPTVSQLTTSQLADVERLARDLVAQADLPEDEVRERLIERVNVYRTRNRQQVLEKAERRQSTASVTSAPRGAVDALPRFWLGQCRRCERDLWVHSQRPRVPVCAGCRGKR